METMWPENYSTWNYSPEDCPQQILPGLGLGLWLGQGAIFWGEGGGGGGWQFSRRIFFVYREANMYEIKYQRPHSQKAVIGIDIGF